MPRATGHEVTEALVAAMTSWCIRRLFGSPDARKPVNRLRNRGACKCRRVDGVATHASSKANQRFHGKVTH